MILTIRDALIACGGGQVHELGSDRHTVWSSYPLDVERHLPELSTYLGHAHPTDTYWYLSAVPELMRLVVKRLEQRSTGRLR